MMSAMFMREVQIKEIVQETPCARTFVLDVLPPVCSYQAGQFINIGVKISDRWLYRSYSFATDPSCDPFPAITVQRVHGGKVSNYMHDHLKAGDVLICSGPQGSFTIAYEPEKSRRFVFLAGGSGITPLYALMKAILHQEPHSTISLIYASRNQGSIIYNAALATLAASYKERMCVTHILSQPAEPWQGLRGRLTAALLVSLLSQPAAESFYFLCGPQGLMELARKTLLEVGVSPLRIRQEDFTLPPVLSQASNVAAEVTMHYQGSTYTTTVAPGTSLLDAALDQGIDVPYSCSSGMCNMCRARCLEGGVAMTNDEGLSEEEKEAGYILTCVGSPATEKLVIAFDED